MCPFNGSPTNIHWLLQGNMKENYMQKNVVNTKGLKQESKEKITQGYRIGTIFKLPLNFKTHCDSSKENMSRNLRITKS